MFHGLTHLFPQRALGKSGEVLGGVGSSGEVWEAPERSGEVWGGLGRSGQVLGGPGRSGELPDQPKPSDFGAQKPKKQKKPINICQNVVNYHEFYDFDVFFLLFGIPKSRKNNSKS